MFLTVNTELLTMLMSSLARDADALGSIKVEVEVNNKSADQVLISAFVFHSLKSIISRLATSGISS